MSKIKVGDQVLKKGDSLESPEPGTVLMVSGNKAKVDWGFVVGWDTLDSLRPKPRT